MIDSLVYVKGDATKPAGTGPKVIPHVCNNLGSWGRGFVVALSGRWSRPEEFYRKWARNESFRLGMVQPVRVEPDVWVINMLAQRGIRRRNDDPPAIDYDRLRLCLKKVGDFALSRGATVHAPKFGSALAGGSWDIIEAIVLEELVDRGLDVSIYILPAEWRDEEQSPEPRTD